MTDYKKIALAQEVLNLLEHVAELQGHTVILTGEIQILKEGLEEAVRYINTTESGGLYCLP
jgi:hypothetical protein